MECQIGRKLRLARSWNNSFRSLYADVQWIPHTVILQDADRHTSPASHSDWYLDSSAKKPARPFGTCYHGIAKLLPRKVQNRPSIHYICVSPSERTVAAYLTGD